MPRTPSSTSTSPSVPLSGLKHGPKDFRLEDALYIHVYTHAHIFPRMEIESGVCMCVCIGAIRRYFRDFSRRERFGTGGPRWAEGTWTGFRGGSENVGDRSGWMISLAIRNDESKISDIVGFSGNVRVFLFFLEKLILQDYMYAKYRNNIG